MTAQDKTYREHFEQALRDHRGGRLGTAIAAYESLLRQRPDDAKLLHHFGVALAQAGRTEEAARCLARSLELDPDRAAVLLNLARALQALKRLPESLQCCERALRLDPNLPEAHRLKAAALAGLGRAEESLAHAGQAVRLAPNDAGANADLGAALLGLGRAADALVCFERAVQIDPALFPAQYNLAMTAAQLGRHDRALSALDRAIALQPNLAALHNNRGNALKALDRLTEAVESFTTALALEPDQFETLHNRAVANALLGQYAEALRDYDLLLSRQGDAMPAADRIGRGAALLGLGRTDEALAVLEQAKTLLPDDVGVHVQLGVALLRLERFGEAVASFDRALALDPKLPEVYNNRAIALMALDRSKEARDNLALALLQNGAAADTHTNLGVVLKTLGSHPDAAWHFNRALEIKPDDAAATFESALLHLTLGDFGEGWPQYEARFRVPALAVPQREFNGPRWRGEPLAGRTLLVHAEQGLGDAIQFCRYLPLLAADGARIVFEVMPALKALLRSLPAAIELVGLGEPLPRFDYHCPLLSLPLLTGTRDLASIPAEVPYLSADPARIERCRAQLDALPGLRVGIAWQGNVRVEKLFWARGRSIPLSALEPLARNREVSLVSLQKGDGLEQLQAVPFKERILDLGPQFDQGPDAFVDAAAVMMGLDLVISSDTAVAHLAGALARPVWVALNATPDWRWMLERGDSPWYPSMRLFRQPRAGDWAAVVAAIDRQLRTMTAARSS